MSLKAFTVQAVKGLMRNWWGVQSPTQFQADENGNVTPVEGGDTMDTGVQAFATELINRLSDDSPIPLPGPIKLIQPSNGPAILIYANDRGGIINGIGGDGSVIQIVGGGGGGGQTVGIQSNGNITSGNIDSGGNVTNITNIFNGGGGGGGEGGGGPGFTGTLTVVTGGSLSTVGCTTTFTATTSVITFQNGQIASVV